jgi:hypothetical protein
MERSTMSAPIRNAPPLSIDCVICGAKMELLAVEPQKHRIVYTYRCINEHLQELSPRPVGDSGADIADEKRSWESIAQRLGGR